MEPLLKRTFPQARASCQVCVQHEARYIEPGAGTSARDTGEELSFAQLCCSQIGLLVSTVDRTLPLGMRAYVLCVALPATGEMAFTTAGA